MPVAPLAAETYPLGKKFLAAVDGDFVFMNFLIVHLSCRVGFVVANRLTAAVFLEKQAHSKKLRGVKLSSQRSQFEIPGAFCQGFERD